jgi:hypothetical protein
VIGWPTTRKLKESGRFFHSLSLFSFFFCFPCLARAWKTKRSGLSFHFQFHRFDTKPTERDPVTQVARGRISKQVDGSRRWKSYKDICARCRRPDIWKINSRYERSSHGNLGPLLAECRMLPQKLQHGRLLFASFHGLAFGRLISMFFSESTPTCMDTRWTTQTAT